MKVEEFAFDTYIPKKLSENEFLYAYLAARQYKKNLPKQAMEDWYDNMDSSFEMLAAGYRFDDERIFEIALEKSLEDRLTQRDVINILVNLPKHLVDINLKHVEEARMMGNDDAAFHLAITRRFGNSNKDMLKMADDIAEEAFLEGDMYHSFDYFLHLRENKELKENRDRYEERLFEMAVYRVKPLFLDDITKKEKQEVVNYMINNLWEHGIFCHHYGQTAYDFFMVDYYDDKITDEKLLIGDFENDFESEYNISMIKK